MKIKRFNESMENSNSPSIMKAKTKLEEIKIKVPYSDIDINNTYFHNIKNPTEFEINLKTDKNIKILDTFKYK